MAHIVSMDAGDWYCAIFSFPRDPRQLDSSGLGYLLPSSINVEQVPPSSSLTLFGKCGEWESVRAETALTENEINFDPLCGPGVVERFGLQSSRNYQSGMLSSREKACPVSSGPSKWRIQLVLTCVSCAVPS